MKPFDIPSFEITIRSHADSKWGKDYLIVCWTLDVAGKETFCRRAAGAEFVQLESFLKLTFEAIKNDLLRCIEGGDTNA